MEAKKGQKERGAMPDACPYAARCGGCDYQGIPYEEQLAIKQREMETLLKGLAPVRPITGMENPTHYRCKVHAVLSRTRKGEVVTGVYEAGSHRVVPIKGCRIENRKADRIITTLRRLIPEFRYRIYDEDAGTGLLRHILIRVGGVTGQILVVLVAASTILPNKNAFVRALLAEHPEITSIVLNVNDRQTNMVLGKRDIVLYGTGTIEDRLCGMTFRISPQSFYQVNPPQAERLYNKAMELAHLTGKERVIDAYCGTGTIGLIASRHAAEVIGVELNADAVKDANANARRNQVTNARFLCADATRFLVQMAEEGEHADVVFLDPPRSGSTPEFLSAAAKLAPSRIVYISCGPDTLARDLKLLRELGYKAEEAWPYDLFGWTKHIETVCLLTHS